MSLIISFAIFIGAVIACIVTGYTLVLALAAGLVTFFICALVQGHRAADVVIMCRKGLSNGLIVVEILLIIGLLTGVWRSSRTIAYFVYYGIRFIRPGIFLIIAFLLTSILSYAIGTSFGVAATVGVIFMTLARTGGVNELITAGVIMSGVYIGDRGSPAASSAILVAAVTRTDHMKNVRIMAKFAAVPFVLILVIYACMSFANPIHQVDESFLTKLSGQFVISPWCLVPAIFMLVLPFFKVRVSYSMIASIVSGMLVSVFVEGTTLKSLFYTMIMGYHSDTSFGSVFNGGGLYSMVEVVLIVGISSVYSGIFEDTKMLEDFQSKIDIMVEKVGRFPSMVIVGLVLIGIFCNQTLATIMGNDLMARPYEKSGASNYELASDIQNSIIILSAVVPWSIACSVPLSFMGVGIGALPYAFYLYLLPIIYGLTKLTKWKFYDRTQ